MALVWVSILKRLSAYTRIEKIHKDTEDKGSLHGQRRELQMWNRED